LAINVLPYVRTSNTVRKHVREPTSEYLVVFLNSLNYNRMLQ